MCCYIHALTHTHTGARVCSVCVCVLADCESEEGVRRRAICHAGPLARSPTMANKWRRRAVGGVRDTRSCSNGSDNGSDDDYAIELEMPGRHSVCVCMSVWEAGAQWDEDCVGDGAGEYAMAWRGVGAVPAECLNTLYTHLLCPSPLLLPSPLSVYAPD